MQDFFFLFFFFKLITYKTAYSCIFSRYYEMRIAPILHKLLFCCYYKAYELSSLLTWLTIKSSLFRSHWRLTLAQRYFCAYCLLSLRNPPHWAITLLNVSPVHLSLKREGISNVPPFSGFTRAKTLTLWFLLADWQLSIRGKGESFLLPMFTLTTLRLFSF